MIGVYDFIASNGLRIPDRPALICDGREYSFCELNQRINRLAYGFHALGIGKGSAVSLLMRNSADFVETIFALWKLGACVSPLNIRGLVDETAALMHMVDSEYLICDSYLLDLAHQAAEAYALACGRQVMLIYTSSQDGLPSLQQLSDNNFSNWCFQEQLDADDEILNIFTGGTTGLPKAAVHTQQSLLSFVLCCYMLPGLYTPEERFLNYSPLCHIGGLRIMLGTLLIGGCMILTSVFEPDAILRMVSEYRITQMFLIPPAIANRLGDIQANESLDLSSLRMVRLSGSATSRMVVEKLFQVFPHIQMTVGFGSSEGAISLFNIFDYPTFIRNPNIYNSVGMPLALCEVRLGNEQGRMVAPGQVGEAQGRSISMLRRYRGRVDTFLADGWFATGDLLYQDDAGNYYFAGRKKDMIKSGGENVYAFEVEKAVQEFPGVAECAVVGLPHEDLGEMVAAAVVLKPGFHAQEEEIIAHCKGFIASYRKPRSVFFVDEFPRNRAGKIQKYLLREQLLQLLREREA